MSDIKIGKITLGMCATNTYFIYREDSKDIVVFDPADRGDYLFDRFSEQGFRVSAIMLTHGHFDHILGIEQLTKRVDAKIYASEDEIRVLANPQDNCSSSFGKSTVVTPDVLLKDGETVSLAGMDICMLKTPGHTEGSCCYYIEEAGFLISGDTLFCESVGRTDFPTGSMSTLIRSIKDKLLILPDTTKVYPGHGEATTIEYEKDNNPFL